MVKHIILWKLRSELSKEQKKEVALAIKAGLEGLKGQVPGLLDIYVQATGQLPSSNADIMLDSTLESPEALLLLHSVGAVLYCCYRYLWL